MKGLVYIPLAISEEIFEDEDERQVMTKSHIAF
jgi:hypothetical protein